MINRYSKSGNTPQGRKRERMEQTENRENEQVIPAMEVTDVDPLDLYRFEITGTISTRCDTCQKRTRLTEQEFSRSRKLQRVLIGDPATCAFCYTGNVRVYGVIAVPDVEDIASK